MVTVKKILGARGTTGAECFFQVTEHKRLLEKKEKILKELEEEREKILKELEEEREKKVGKKKCSFIVSTEYIFTLTT